MTKKISIIVGSVLGATEYVAEAVEVCLQEKGYTTQVFLTPSIDEIPLDSHWLVCTSTHGAGDLPDNIVAFSKSLETADLSSLNASLIGLGDSSYDTFCFGVETMEQKLTKAGCTISHPTHTIDVLTHPIPEDNAVEWVKRVF